MDYRTAIITIAKELEQEERAWRRSQILDSAPITMALIYRTTTTNVVTDLFEARQIVGDFPCPITSKS